MTEGRVKHEEPEEDGPPMEERSDLESATEPRDTEMPDGTQQFDDYRSDLESDGPKEVPLAATDNIAECLPSEPRLSESRPDLESGS